MSSRSNSSSEEAEEHFKYQELLTGLRIPPDYARFEQLEDSAFAELDKWRTRTVQALRKMLDREELAGPFDVEAHAQLVYTLVPFVQDLDDAEAGVYQDWTSAEADSSARALLEALPAPTPPVVKRILTQIIKPLFQATPHPQLHHITGRVIPGRGTQEAGYAGGADASQDFYDEQVWKTAPGVGAVVVWCAAHLDPPEYESLWTLLVPPVMTLLDDYEAGWKLWGVHAVREVLLRVPPELLRRTGVYGLFRKSLQTALAHQTRRESERLIRCALRTWLSLTAVSTAVGTKERFDSLAALLGEGIINSIWVYAEDRPAVVLATIEILPPLLDEMGLGAARFVGALVRQLSFLLSHNSNMDMQLAAVRALRALVRVCSVCLGRWGMSILEAAARCWVGRRDAAAKGLEEFPSALQEDLRHLCTELSAVVPTAIQANFTRLAQADPDMFTEMFQGTDFESTS